MKKLTLIDKAFLLKKNPLFGNLDLDLLLTISDKLGLVSFEAGETLFTPGENGQRMYFIVKGHVEIVDSKQISYCTLLPGDFFGDESLLSDFPRAYGVVCKTDVQLLTLSKTNLLTIIAECPSVAIELLEVYASQNPIRFNKQEVV